MKCYFCNSDTEPSLINNIYNKCTNCLTEINKDFKFKILETADYYQGGVVQGFDLNKQHYDRLTKTLFSEVGWNESFTKHYNKILSFGAGNPKLESYFSADEIVAYDLFASMYEKFDLQYKQIFTPKSTISYRAFDYEANSIKSVVRPYKKQQLLLSFVHSLEHLTWDLWGKVFDDLLGIRGENIKFMLYQPNLNTASPTWIHYGIYHNILMSTDVISKYLTDKGFKITYLRSYDLDTMVIFE